MSALPAKTGWAWLKQAMSLFRKQPAALTTVMFGNVLLSILLGNIPLLGQVAAVVLVPSFSMALMQACLMIDHNERVTPSVLLTGFRKPAVINLCKVGLAYLAVTAVLTLMAYLMIGESFWKQAATPAANPVVDPSDLMGVLLVALLQVATVIALCFAAPLVFWQQMTPAKAIFFSFFAVLRSLRVFVVMLMAWFGMFMAATVVLLMVLGNGSMGRVVLTWVAFLFILLLQCAMYAGYRQVFGVPELKGKPGPAL
ncbi:BPSS1780 family membrane protein [Massilia sp. TWR1-2-2]|uniref:BPSS1780 family membrane protein n=1 Tax=Massilia sp. TWR1-2-2 TaxID=2804584 RepID=UPI003CEC2081